ALLLSSVQTLPSTTLAPALSSIFLSLPPPPPTSTLFPYTTLFRSPQCGAAFSGLVSLRSRTEGSVRIPISSFGHCLLSEIGEIRSEEHTSELQSLTNLVCRLLLEKKKKYDRQAIDTFTA